MVTEVILPVLGETMSMGTFVEWLKQEGAPVERGEAIYTLESDKAILEVESPGAGFVRKILVPAGQTVPVLTVVALITKTIDEDVSTYEVRSSEKRETQSRPSAVVRLEADNIQAMGPARGRIFASPRARRLARAKQVDLGQVPGTGPSGRITEKDLRVFLKNQPRVTPVARELARKAGVDPGSVQGTGAGGLVTKEDVKRAIERARPGSGAPAGAATAASAPGTEVPTSSLRAIISNRMLKSHQTTAPVTLTVEANATCLVELRGHLRAALADELGFDIGYNEIFVKLSAQALTQFPYMNARLTGDSIEQVNQVHVALAVNTERGLVVAVIRNADRKGLAEIARELLSVTERARAGKALPDDLSGSTFTITNLGMYDIDAFTPIINLPEAAILGIGRIKPRPAVVDGRVCVQQMMWLSLTFDHRLVDGAPAALFLQYIKNLIEEPYRWLAMYLR